MTYRALSSRHPAAGPDPSDRPLGGPAGVGNGVEALLKQGYRFALSLTHDPARAEDLLQDAWVALLSAGGPRTAAYLITAIRSRFIDDRRRALIAPTESMDDKPAVAAEAENATWDDPCHAIALKTTLHRVLGLLRAEERAVLLLSAVEGYTAREIGKLLDAPRGTVLSLMYRTRAKLRRWLDDRPDVEERR